MAQEELPQYFGWKSPNALSSRAFRKGCTFRVCNPVARRERKDSGLGQRRCSYSEPACYKLPRNSERFHNEGNSAGPTMGGGTCPGRAESRSLRPQTEWTE